MHKVRLCFVIVLAAILILSGCSEKRITEGEIISVEFSPEHNKITMMPITTYVGGVTKVTLYPVIYHYPDSWYITIQGYIEGENKPLTARYRVTEDVYNSVWVGKNFVYKENMEPDEPEYTKERK